MMICSVASRRFVLLTAVVGMAAVTGSNARGTEIAPWNTFDPDNQGFSVLMPGTPKAKEIHNKSFIGDVTTHEYDANDGLDTYSVDFTDLPGFAVIFAGSNTIYEHAKGALLKETLSKAISFTDVTLNGVKGKRLVYDTPSKPDHPEMRGEARFFLFGDRLYGADAVVEIDNGKEKLDRFFSSLEITKKN